MAHISNDIITIGPSEAGKIRQVLAWGIPIASGLIPLDLLVNYMLGYRIFLYHSVIMTCFVAVTLLAFWLARRDEVRKSAVTITVALYVAMFPLVLIMPSLMATGIVMTVMAVILLLPYLAPREILPLLLVTVVAGIAIFMLGTFMPPLVDPLPPLVANLYGAFGFSSSLILALLLLWQYSNRLIGIIAQTRASNVALEEVRASLETTVDARTADLSRALGEVEARAAAQALLLEENAQQREAIREMSVPVMPVADSAIVIPLIGTLNSERLLVLQEQALKAIEHNRARYVLLDITGIPLIDTAIAKGLLTVAQSTKLLGSEAILVGVRPEVAQTLVALGIDMSWVHTRQSLQEGIAYVFGKK